MLLSLTLPGWLHNSAFIGCLSFPGITAPWPFAHVSFFHMTPSLKNDCHSVWGSVPWEVLSQELSCRCPPQLIPHPSPAAGHVWLSPIYTQELPRLNVALQFCIQHTAQKNHIPISTKSISLNPANLGSSDLSPYFHFTVWLHCLPFAYVPLSSTHSLTLLYAMAELSKHTGSKHTDLAEIRMWFSTNTLNLKLDCYIFPYDNFCLTDLPLPIRLLNLSHNFLRPFHLPSNMPT